MKKEDLKIYRLSLLTNKGLYEFDLTRPEVNNIIKKDLTIALFEGKKNISSFKIKIN